MVAAASAGRRKPLALWLRGFYASHGAPKAAKEESEWQNLHGTG